MHVNDTETIRAGLLHAWESVLGAGSADDENISFFDLGGDSLRVVHLWLQIEEFYDGHIDIDRFIERPTFANMFSLLTVIGFDNINDNEISLVAPDLKDFLTDARSPIVRRQLYSVNKWPGTRPTPDGLFVGFHENGTKPALFVCCQCAHEIAHLADLGVVDQPLYGFRSGRLVMTYAEEEIKALSLIYSRNIETIYPNGPIFLIGYCQGAIITREIAKLLIAGGRDVPVLTFLEWRFGALEYDHCAHLVYGNDSEFADKIYSENMGETNQRFVKVTNVPGQHSSLLSPPYVSETFRVISEEISKRQLDT